MISDVLQEKSEALSTWNVGFLYFFFNFSPFIPVMMLVDLESLSTLG